MDYYIGFDNTFRVEVRLAGERVLEAALGKEKTPTRVVLEIWEEGSGIPNPTREERRRRLLE